MIFKKLISKIQNNFLNSPIGIIQLLTEQGQCNYVTSGKFKIEFKFSKYRILSFKETVTTKQLRLNIFKMQRIYSMCKSA